MRPSSLRSPSAPLSRSPPPSARAETTVRTTVNVLPRAGCSWPAVAGVRREERPRRASPIDGDNGPNATTNFLRDDNDVNEGEGEGEGEGGDDGDEKDEGGNDDDER